MSSYSRVCCLLLLLGLPFIIAAFIPGRGRYSKRMFGRVRGAEAPGRGPNGRRKLFFKTRDFTSISVARRHQSTFLECEAGGSPAPTIHWLKDGDRMTQGGHEQLQDENAVYEEVDNDAEQEVLGLSSTKSRLYLPCPTLQDEGEYTCVAQTPYMRKTQSTILKVEGPALSGHHSCLSKRSVRGEAARVYMWTVSRLEYEHNTVQLFCRAYGVPQPTITWYDSLNNTVTEDDDQISFANNGDLVIRDISWFSNMGVYRCEAQNPLGLHSVEAFLYPTPRDDMFNLPV